MEGGREGGGRVKRIEGDGSREDGRDMKRGMTKFIH